jgi:hypothetical protein
MAEMVRRELRSEGWSVRQADILVDYAVMNATRVRAGRHK